MPFRCGVHSRFVAESFPCVHSFWSYCQTSKDDKVAELGAECRALKPKKKVKFESPLSQNPLPTISCAEPRPTAAFTEVKESLTVIHNCSVTENLSCGSSKNKSGRNAKMLPPFPSFTKNPLQPPFEKPENPSKGGVPAVSKHPIQAR